MFTKKTLYLVCTVCHGGQASEHRTMWTWDGRLPLTSLLHGGYPSVHTNVRVDRIAQPSHAPNKPSMDPNLWNPKGPSLSWEITKMGRTSEGSDDDPGRFASGYTMELEGGYVCASSVDHTVDGMLYPP